MQNSKKVLVLGITGLIGKELPPYLVGNYDVYAITRKEIKIEGVTTLVGDIFDCAFLKNVFKDIKPEYLINLSWYTTNDYLISKLNYSYLQKGIEILQFFAENGGKKALYVGTCFEYKFLERPIKETDELDINKNAYTYCKGMLQNILERMAYDYNVKLGYARLFYVYGRDESPTRLFGAMFTKLLRNESITIYGKDLQRDYMYTKDIAEALIAFLSSDEEGVVNICTGKAYSLGFIAKTVSEYLGKEDLVHFEKASMSQPQVIVGDNTRLLKELCFIPKYNLELALDEILNSYLI